MTFVTAFCFTTPMKRMKGKREPPDVTFILYSDDDSIEDVGESSQVRIPAHRKVMAAASSPFRCMLEGDFTESRAENIVIRGVSPATFRSLVEFIYSGKLADKFREWELPDVLRLLLAADRYELKALATEVIAQISCHLTVQTLWEVLAVADVLSVSQPTLLVACEDFLAANLTEVASAGNSRFGLCPEKVFLAVLSRGWLQGVQSECDVYRAAVRWLDEDVQRLRNPVLRRRAMECIRFPCMSPQEFSLLARRSELVDDFLEREALCVFSGLAQLSTHWPTSMRHSPRTMAQSSMVFSPVSCEESRLSMTADRQTVVCVADGAGSVFVRQCLLSCLEHRQHTVWRLDLRNCVHLPSLGVAVYNAEGQFMAACGLCSNSGPSTPTEAPHSAEGDETALCSFQRVSLSMDPVTGDFVPQSDMCSLHFGRSASISFMFKLENDCPAACAVRTAHSHARLFTSVLTPRQHTSLAFIEFPNSYHLCPYVGLRPGMIATIGTTGS